MSDANNNSNQSINNTNNLTLNNNNTDSNNQLQVDTNDTNNTPTSSSSNFSWYQGQVLEGQAVYHARRYILNEYTKYKQYIPKSQQNQALKHTLNDQSNDIQQGNQLALSRPSTQSDRIKRANLLNQACEQLTNCYKTALIWVCVSGGIGFFSGRMMTRNLSSTFLRYFTPVLTTASLMYTTITLTTHSCDLQFLRSNQPIAVEARRVAKIYHPSMFDDIENKDNIKLS